MIQQLTKNNVDKEYYMRDARANDEWPFNKCVDIRVIMLQRCVCMCREMVYELSD